MSDRGQSQEATGRVATVIEAKAKPRAVRLVRSERPRKRKVMADRVRPDEPRDLPGYYLG